MEKLILAQRASPMTTTTDILGRNEEEICERLKIVEEDAKVVEEEQGSGN